MTTRPEYESAEPTPDNLADSDAEAQELAPAAATAEPPPAPRPLTGRVGRRTWAEQPVRLWAIVAVALLLASVVVTITSVSNALAIRRVLVSGIEAQARIENFVGLPHRELPKTREPAATLIYTIDGQTYDAQEKLPTGDGFYYVGDTVPIRVDPANPRRLRFPGGAGPWTPLVKIALVLPFAVVVAGIAWFKRRGVLATWRNGDMAEAEVTGVKQSALAPRSSTIGFRYSYGYDNRVYHLYWPNKLGRLEPGDVIHVIHKKDKPAGAIPVGAYISPAD